MNAAAGLNLAWAAAFFAFVAAEVVDQGFLMNAEPRGHAGVTNGRPVGPTRPAKMNRDTSDDEQQ
jgi:hypothetical protein